MDVAYSDNKFVCTSNNSVQQCIFLYFSIFTRNPPLTSYILSLEFKFSQSNFQRGTILHKQCRQQLINPLRTETYDRAEADTLSDESNSSAATTRAKTRKKSCDTGFDFRTDCLFCGKSILRWVVGDDVSKFQYNKWCVVSDFMVLVLILNYSALLWNRNIN